MHDVSDNTVRIMINRFIGFIPLPVYPVATRLVQTGLCVLVLLATGCTTVTPEDRLPEYYVLRDEISPVQTYLANWGGVAGGYPEPTATPRIREFYRHTLGTPGVAQHDTVGISSLGEIMAVHLLYPENPPRGTVLVIHGYLAYPAEMDTIARELVGEDYLVVIPALPGHGLSGGEPAGINDFSDYGRFVADVMTPLMEFLPVPRHAIGHSTGATALYEYIREIDDPFDAVVFLAPLVRSAWYRASLVGRFFTRPFVDHVDTGIDTAAHELMIPSTMPMTWFDAQVRWNQRKHTFPVVTRPVLTVQGDLDTVVEWRYNQQFLERALACHRWELIPGGRHVLHGSDPVIRRITLDIVGRYLETYPAGAACR